jgi:sec-independent protein translocase protein TatA
MMPTLALLSDVGGGEILVVGVIALLLFGKNLPTVSRTIGKTIAQFKHAISSASSEINKEMEAAADEAELSKIDTVSGARSNGSKPAEANGAKPVPAASVSQPARQAPPAISQAAALDTLKGDVPPPSKIPPPVV